MRKMSTKSITLVIGLFLFGFLFGTCDIQHAVTGQSFSVIKDTYAIDTTPAEIHEGAWALTVDTARTNPYYKYGIYASRVLAVKHPEVYLKADAMFLRAVNYKEMKSNVRRGTEYIHTASTFCLDDVDLNQYHIMKISDFYEGYPVLPFLDHRAFSLSSTIKKLNVQQKYVTDQDRITQLNKAILYYLKEGDTNTYLMYCDDETSYICNGLCLSADTLEETSITGNPILIFNEYNVWYPLMGRDDTGKDTTLKTLVDTYATDVQTPVLTPFEKNVIGDLALVTALDAEDQFTMAVLSASKTYAYCEHEKEWFEEGEGPEDFITNDEVAEKWMHIFPDLDSQRFFTAIPPFPFGGVDYALINEVIKRGNYVSPVTAHLAYTAVTESKGDTMAAVSIGYRDMGYSWCALWILGMQGYTIDETMYTGGGTCQVHAYNIGAVLDVAGIDNYILDGYQIGQATHLINYVPSYDVVSTDGQIVGNLTTILYCPKYFMFLSHEEQWAYIVKNNYFGLLLPLEAEEYLSFLKKQHHDDIRGLTSTGGQTYEISYEELCDFLKAEQEKFESLELPMTFLPARPINIKVELLKINPEAVDPGEPITITVEVINEGDHMESRPVTLKINGVREARQYLTLEPGETTTVSFVVVKEKRGTYHVEVDNSESTFRVRWMSFPILAGCAVITAAFLFIKYAGRLWLLRFAAKKTVAGLITIFLVMSMLFLLLHAVPGGDPVDRIYLHGNPVLKERIRTYWGMDKPLFYQYILYMKKAFTFNFELWPNAMNASHVILYVLPFTILLFGTATLLSYFLGALLGSVLLSGKKSRWRSSVVYTFILFYVLPAFVLGIFFKNWFVFKWYIFPPVSISVIKGYTIWGIYENVAVMHATYTYTALFKTLLPEMVLPLIVLVLVGVARPLLLMRDHMAITLGEPHVVTARAKGLKERAIRFRHVARNALLPLVNDASVNLVYIFGGGILIEYVFKWPGVGYVLFEGLKVLSIPLISAAIFVLTCVLVVSMITADLVSAYLDPRIGVVK